MIGNGSGRGVLWSFYTTSDNYFGAGLDKYDTESFILVDITTNTKGYFVFHVHIASIIQDPSINCPPAKCHPPIIYKGMCSLQKLLAYVL